MNRLRLHDIRTSRLASTVGICHGDVAEFAQLVNAAQTRLLFAPQAGEEGWWGGWAEVAFDVDPANPIITSNRHIARIQNLNYTLNSVPIFNQWYEFVQFGNGRMKDCGCGQVKVIGRNNAVTRRDITDAPQILRFYSRSTNDQNRRIFVQGIDASDNVIRSEDNGGVVNGIFLALQQPFVDTPFGVKSLTGLQKDVTSGEVQVMQVDPVTGEEIELHLLEPSETTAWYRRYKLAGVPCSKDVVQVRAIVKIELIPAIMDPDYLLIQEKEAIIEECMAVHYLSMDTIGGKSFSQIHHKNAIGFLNGQLRHYLGDTSPTIVSNNFGSARLEKQRIGTLI